MYKFIIKTFKPNYQDGVYKFSPKILKQALRWAEVDIDYEDIKNFIIKIMNVNRYEILTNITVITSIEVISFSRVINYEILETIIDAFEYNWLEFDMNEIPMWVIKVYDEVKCLYTLGSFEAEESLEIPFFDKNKVVSVYQALGVKEGYFSNDFEIRIWNYFLSHVTDVELDILLPPDYDYYSSFIPVTIRQFKKLVRILGLNIKNFNLDESPLWIIKGIPCYDKDGGLED